MRLNFKKAILSSIASIIAISAIYSIGSVEAVPPKLNPAPSDYSTGISYNEAKKLKKPIAVNFYVDWCGYCKRFAPVLDSVRKEYSSKYTFVYVNVEENSETRALAQNFGISGYPSLFLVNPKTGKRVFVSQSIYTNKKELKKEFDKFYKKNK